MTWRRPAAFVAADVAGYSRLMHADEEGTHARFTALMTNVIEPAIAQHSERVVKSTGDGFSSAVAARTCALQFQTQATLGAARKPPDRRLAFRVGIHLGDVIVEKRDICGDGVNVAARLEALAEPGGIAGCASPGNQVVLSISVCHALARGMPPGAGLGARRSPSLHYFHSLAGTSADQPEVAFLGSVAVPDGGRPLRARQDSAIVL